MKKDDTKDKNDDLAQKVTELENRVADLNNKYLRSLADYQNLEKQTDAWKADFVKFSNQDLLKELLEVVDYLELLQAHYDKDNSVDLILSRFKSILRAHGLEEIEMLNREFDPVTAEAVEVIPGEENNKIVAVLQRGYKLNGRVVRPAKVRVSKKE